MRVQVADDFAYHVISNKDVGIICGSLKMKKSVKDVKVP